MKAALYVRCSTTRQDTDVQLEALRRVASARGWDGEEFIDSGVSGSEEGPELQRMMKDARQGKFDIVAVWKFDRFSRSMSHLVNSLHEFEVLGVDFYSYTETLDTTTPIGRAMFGVIAAMAQFERDLIRERIREGIARAKAAGKHCGRPKRKLNVEGAKKLLAAGHTLRQVSFMVNIPRSTLRRRLQEEGFLPVPQESGDNVVSLV